MKKFISNWIGNYRWLIEIVIYSTIVVFVIIQFVLPYSIDIDSERYVLSAISQGLAALLGMTFTISLIMMQVSHKEPGLLGDFFKDKFNALYPIIMAFGIIVPLVVLKYGWYGTGTNVSISLCILSVFLILPYFLRMKNNVWLNVGIKSRFDNAKQALQTNDFYEYAQIIDSMVELVKISLGTNYLVYEYCYAYLYDLGKDWVRRADKNDEIMATTMERFCDVLSMMPERRIRHKDFPKQIYELANNIVKDFKLKNISFFAKLLDALGKIAKPTQDSCVRTYLGNAVLSLSSSWIEQNRSHASAVRKYLYAHARNLEHSLSISSIIGNLNQPPETAKSQARREIEQTLLVWLRKQGIKIKTA